MILLYGKQIAERIFDETQKRIAEARVTPGLGVILVGNDPASHLYVGLKEKAAERVGISFEKKIFKEDVLTEEIVKSIHEFNLRTDIHGILVQLPLPLGFPTDEIIASIEPKKDTDGFHRTTIDQFLSGDADKCPVFPRALMEMLHETKESVRGERGVVVANSELMGMVMARALSQEGMIAEYILSHVGKEKVAEKTKAAKVIITACGIPRFITGEMVSEGSIVLDGGIEHEEHRVVGDVDEMSVSNKVAFLSPVPGGVGPVTVATLLARVTDAALK